MKFCDTLKSGIQASVSQSALAAVTVACLAVAPWTARASIVYTINQSSTTPEVQGEPSPLSDTVTGTITTDGTIGVIQSSDILSWNLDLIDNLNPAYDVVLTPSNSGIVFDTGNGLTASATALSFNFSDAGAEFAIQGTTHGFYSGYQYFCFQATTGACATGETIVPDYYDVDGVAVTNLSGTVPLNPPPSGTPVPEPTSLVLLASAIGIASLVTLRWRSRTGV